MTQIEAQLDPVQTGQAFRALIAMVGTATSDGRIFDALTWREPPLTVYAQMINTEGHDQAPIVGRIDRVERNLDEVWGFGVLDTGSDVGREAIRMIREKFLRGVSVDAAVLDFTESDDGLAHFSAEVGALTIVGFPAFRETEIELVEAAMDHEFMPGPDGKCMICGMSKAEHEMAAAILVESGQPVDLGAGVAVLASARPIGPPREWFAQPALDKRYGLHVEPDGRIWGHVYGWGECHIGSPPGGCIQLHAHAIGYEQIIDVDGRGVLCADGTFVRTGPLVIAADHADLGMSWMRAKDHYANTALAVGDVVIGPDEHGIWCAGAIRPGTSETMIHALRASQPSVDCRDIAGRLEVISLLAVNTPGFPARSKARFAEGRVISLVASGAPVEEGCGCGGTSALSEVLERLESLERDLAPVRAAEVQARAQAVAELEADLGIDDASVVARLEAELLV